KPDRVVAPVVRETAVEQMAVVDEGVDRQELDRSHPERLDVLDYGRGAETLIGSAMRLGYAGVALGKAAQMGLVDDRAIPGDGAAARLALPVEIGVDDDAFVHVRLAVALVESRVVPAFHAVAEHCRMPLEVAEMAAGIGVEQQLMRVEAVAGGGLVGTVYAVAVNRAGPDAARIAVPHLVG